MWNAIAHISSFWLVISCFISVCVGDRRHVWHCPNYSPQISKSNIQRIHQWKLPVGTNNIIAPSSLPLPPPFLFSHFLPQTHIEPSSFSRSTANICHCQKTSSSTMPWQRPLSQSAHGYFKLSLVRLTVLSTVHVCLWMCLSSYPYTPHIFVIFTTPSYHTPPYFNINFYQ